MNKKTVIKNRNEILRALLLQKPFMGWNWDNVLYAADETGLGRAMALAVFPHKMRSIMDALASWADSEMLQKLAHIEAGTLPVRGRIHHAVLARFKILTPYKEAIRQAVAFDLMPQQKIHTARLVWQTADHIWNWAGDTTTDYNHYTKRILLSGILASTTLAWLNENRNGETLEAFLDRRIEDVMQLNTLIAPLKKKA